MLSCKNKLTKLRVFKPKAVEPGGVACLGLIVCELLVLLPLSSLHFVMRDEPILSEIVYTEPV